MHILKTASDLVLNLIPAKHEDSVAECIGIANLRERLGRGLGTRIRRHQGELVIVKDEEVRAGWFDVLRLEGERDAYCPPIAVFNDRIILLRRFAQDGQMQACK